MTTNKVFFHPEEQHLGVFCSDNTVMEVWSFKHDLVWFRETLWSWLNEANIDCW